MMLRRCGDIMSEDEKRLIEDKIEQIIGWLDWNYLCGDVSLFEQKKAELQSVCDHVLGMESLITKVTELNNVD